MNGNLSDLERLELAGDAILFEDFKQTDYYRVLAKYGAMLLENLKLRTLSGNREEFDYNKGAYTGASDALNLVERIIQVAALARESKKNAPEKVR